jgi:hypothetical protein
MVFPGLELEDGITMVTSDFFFFFCIVLTRMDEEKKLDMISSNGRNPPIVFFSTRMHPCPAGRRVFDRWRHRVEDPHAHCCH